MFYHIDKKYKEEEKKILHFLPSTKWRTPRSGPDMEMTGWKDTAKQRLLTFVGLIPLGCEFVAYFQHTWER